MGKIDSSLETHKSCDPCEILLVEDEPADARLTMEVLKSSKIDTRIRHVLDGEQALAYLRRQEPFENAIRPDLILLDLNLPKIDGREVLAEVKSDLDLRRIPVLILTTSRDEEDILDTYDLHANCFITKPIQLANFVEVARSVENFWLGVVQLPPRD
jgi:CheY-like chemotaxis protein